MTNKPQYSISLPESLDKPILPLSETADTVPAVFVVEKLNQVIAVVNALREIVERLATK